MAEEDPFRIVSHGELIDVKCENKRIITIRTAEGVKRLEFEISSFVEDIIKEYIGDEVVVRRNGDVLPVIHEE